MTLHRTRPRGIRRTIRVAVAIALSASFTLTSAAIAQASVPDDFGPNESYTPLTNDVEQVVAVGASDPGTFVSLDPARLLDTRVGNGAAQAPVAPSGTIGVQVTGRGGVPATGVAAVVVNVTVTGPASSGFITVYPSGTSQPTASNLNFTAGQTIPNLVTVKVGGNGKIDLTNNSAGTVDLIADVAGYFIASPEELSEVWPTGWIFDDCGTEWDGLLLLATPGIVYSPQGPLVFFEGENYYEYLPGVAGEVVVTASAEPGYVMVVDPTQWVTNADDSVTATIQFTNEPCP